MAAAAFADNGRQVEVEAATEAARIDLRSQVLAVYVAPGVPLRDVVANDPNAVNIDGVIAKAEIVGEPRWIGEDIVQVKLHLAAGRLVEAVKASIKMLSHQMSASDFDRFKHEWAKRSFQATGQAIPAARVRQVVLTMQPAGWAGVPDDARIAAAQLARTNATAALIDQTDAIHLGPTQTIDAALDAGHAKPALVTWANTLPATNITMGDDRQIEVGLFVDKPGLSDVLKSSLPSAFISQPDHQQALATGIHGLPDIVVGRSIAGAVPATAPTGALIIRQIPVWASDPITASGEAKFSTTQLRTARAAERSAREALREKIFKLPIDNGATIGQAAQRENVRAAVDEAVEQATVYQVNYHADGSADVSVTLDPNDLLDALTGAH